MRSNRTETMNLCSASAANACFFKRPHTHDLGVEEVSRLRKFLKEAGPGAQVEKNRPSPAG